MARDPKHPRAEPSLLPVLTLAAIVALQVTMLQVGVNRLSWGMYLSVYGPAAATLGLSLLAWLLYRHFDRETL